MMRVEESIVKIKSLLDVSKQTPGCIINMTAVQDTTDMMESLNSVSCGSSFVPRYTKWNGASVGPLRNLPIIGFPKWKHPLATLRHDYRCSVISKSAVPQYSKAEFRAKADKCFYTDVGVRGTKWEQIKGYIGVRIGAILGIGF